MILKDFIAKYHLCRSTVVYWAKRYKLQNYIEKREMITYSVDPMKGTYARHRKVWCIDEPEEFLAILKARREQEANNKKTGWTNILVDCYDARCTCEKCFNNKTCTIAEKYNPTIREQLKGTVLKLYAKYGAPISL